MRNINNIVKRKFPPCRGRECPPEGPFSAVPRLPLSRAVRLYGEERGVEHGIGPIGEPRRGGPAWALVPLALAVAAAAGVGLWLDNRLVGQREAVDAAWAQVESSYQRRADLVPALVEAVRSHMRHESETLERVVSARAQAMPSDPAEALALAQAASESGRALAETQGRVPASESDLARVSASQAGVGRAIQRVLALAEAYPTLRSADQFLELQAQLEGSENRIHVARTLFNEAVREYNAALEQFPTRRFAQARGFERRAYFRTDAPARRAAPLGLD